MSEEYRAFLDRKRLSATAVGIEVAEDALHPALFGFQRRIVAWTLRRGKAAVFASTGLGKTLIQLEWARHVYRHTERPVLILAPLAVTHQTAREALKLDLGVSVVRQQGDVGEGIHITNYEMLEHFDPAGFGGIVADEGSILKAFDGTMRRRITEFAAEIPWRMDATATPAPNDLTELGCHAEFLGVMSVKEMAALFFRQRGENVHQWSLKGHARVPFYQWLASWSIACRKPSDLGFPDDGFDLPPLSLHQHEVECETAPAGRLFPVEAVTLDEVRGSMRATLPDRVRMCADLVNADREPWLVWCHLNAESEALARAIPDAVEVKGSDSVEEKERRLMAFADGEARVLVSKASICGFGMNFQHCARVAFVGLSYSWEQYFQAIRRCWRFGQTRAVEVHVITANTEGRVVAAIERKEQQAEEMMSEIVSEMRDYQADASIRQEVDYREETARGADWTLHLGDCVEQMREIETESVGLALCSPPFPSMYAYTNSSRDMGNVRSIEEMIGQFRFLVDADHLLRVMMPGRVFAVHLQQAMAFKHTEGYTGLKDFRGSVIATMEDAGWHYTGEACIEKNPQPLRDGTRILTPAGWTPIEELRVGDAVIGANGRETRVTAIPYRGRQPVYHLTFDDGAVIECGASHLWPVRTSYVNPWYLLTAEQIAHQGVITPSGKWRYQIPVMQPAELAGQKELPIPPKLLGALLADGSLQSDTVSICKDRELVESLPLPAGHHTAVRPRTERAGGRTMTYGIIGGERGRNDVLNALRELRLAGSRAWEKFIPEPYLFASIKDRRELLRGLLDGDGRINPRGSICYRTTSSRLAHDVTFLVQSLGGLATPRKKPGSRYGEGLQGRPIWEVGIRLNGEWCPFTLERKARHWSYERRSIYRNIVAAELVGTASVTCITVAAEDGLFVAEGCVVTHNSKAARTKDRGLLFKTLATDSSLMTMAQADYLLYFRKPGQNPHPVRAGISKRYDNPDGWITNEEWIEWASPIWRRSTVEYPQGIRETDTLNVAVARDAEDERHLCPLQLGVCERAIKLWSAPGELVLDPFTGIGSVGVTALKLNRRFVGVELKESYFKTACRYLKEAERHRLQPSLLSLIEEEEEVTT